MIPGDTARLPLNYLSLQLPCRPNEVLHCQALGAIVDLGGEWRGGDFVRELDGVGYVVELLGRVARERKAETETAKCRQSAKKEPT